MLSVIALSALVAITVPVAASTIPRVRPMTDQARAIVQEAAQRSPTIARLLRIIESSDAIVYIDLQFDLRSDGATTIIAANDQCRFIRIALSRSLAGLRRFEMLGHELQHAVEIIQAPNVRDATSLRGLFSKIGWILSDVSFESGAAITAERQVQQEMRLSALRR